MLVKNKVFTLRPLANSIMLLLGAAIGMASLPTEAQLLDHGPADPTLIWPQWYRANDGTAVGLCKSQTASPNAAAAGAPMCFPLVADPAAFAGNVGPEVFYNMVEYKQKPGAATAFNFRYMAALEASYIPGPAPAHGQETVFARVRIAFNFNDPLFNGHYKVTHPFGVDEFDAVATTFNSVQGSQASVFYTNDVPLGVAGNFDAALEGMIGPFIQWDVINPGETLTVGGQQFLGDPNYPHTFTGSPFIDAAGNPQNYVKIEGPAGANLGNGPGVPLIITEMNVLGQKWTAPIVANLVVEQAVKARSNTNGKNSIDVWATSTPGHKLVLTGVNMPSMQMIEDQIARGHYHGHIEYPVAQPIPPSVFVTDNTSVPIISAEKQLVDGVEISLAQYDTNTGDINIKANSTDEVSPLPNLIVENIPGVPSALGVTPVISANMTTAACILSLPAFSGAAATDKCFHATLPITNEPPKFINVRSSSGGSHDGQLVMLTGNPQNKTPAPVQGDVSLSVSSTGTSVLLLPANSLIVTQPSQGSIALVSGQYQFTAKVGAVSGPDSFKFVVQNPATGAVSAQATANLTLTFTATPPTANLDQFAARVSTNLTTANFPQTLNVLANDVPATTDAPNQFAATNAVIIASQPIRGTATANANGTITYRATSAGADSFTYRVKNAANQFSLPATVQMTNFAAAESVSFKTTPDYTKGRWSALTGTTSWFGPNLTQTSVSCYLITSGGATLATPALISVPAIVDATGAFQVAGGVTTPVATAAASVRCTSSNGGNSPVTTITVK